ncbi:hypothetical protein K501DRAFT_41512 [Backusella circina FSU 941]|nr:hypothetical protein K501DRAFT_41512 [Backusella circina FSU 941]
MATIYFDDGSGKLTDENDNEVIEYQMEVDNEEYPLTSITTFSSYLDLKPPEKPKKANKVEETSSKPEAKPEKKTERTYRKYKKEDMEKFYFLVFEKNMSIRGAAKELKIPPGTAQTWYTKGQKSIESGEDLYLRKPGSGRLVGRPLTINSEQKECLVKLIDQKPGIVLDEMMGGLTSQFTNLDISRSSLYKYVTAHCGMSVKRALFRPAERNSDTKIEARFQWVTELLKTDIDYMTNCVFIDESGFNINMKRSMAWAPVGETPRVEIPKTRATSHTIIGAISPLGVINVQLKVPKVVVASNSKKRKGPGGAIKKTGERERERWDGNWTLFQLCS